ncbi:Uncharacterized protein APZ42_028107 [Daphnia magna]|uniref:Uncharacterized protein n=1 Tax=Daphnia magna TaxID=35525 RepID=A0A164QUC5_9CRUS|nr:Uncharacterized protein APZ42_028107 [Daphnia magna]
MNLTSQTHNGAARGGPFRVTVKTSFFFVLFFSLSKDIDTHTKKEGTAGDRQQHNKSNRSR